MIALARRIHDERRAGRTAYHLLELAEAERLRRAPALTPEEALAAGVAVERAEHPSLPLEAVTQIAEGHLRLDPGHYDAAAATRGAGRSDFAERRARRIERLDARSAAKEAEAAARFQASHDRLDRIPLGQPILVGHHSERRHRSDVARANRDMSQGVAAKREAEDLARRATSAREERSISSDDPDAIEKLRERLAAAQRDLEETKVVNALLRAPNAAARLRARGYSTEQVASLMRPMPGKKKPGLSTLNAAANVRRIEQRIAQLEERAKTAKPADHVRGAWRATWDGEENRVKVLGPDAPKDERKRRAQLFRARGFVWSPRSGAWQRMASDGAWYRARQLVDELG